MNEQQMYIHNPEYQNTFGNRLRSLFGLGPDQWIENPNYAGPKIGTPEWQAQNGGTFSMARQVAARARAIAQAAEAAQQEANRQSTLQTNAAMQQQQAQVAQLYANNPYVQLAQHSVTPATIPQQTQFVRPPPAPDLSNVGVKSAHKPVHRSQQRSVARPVVRQQPRGELITNNGVTFRRLPDGSLELVSGPITATAAQWGVR